MKGTVPIHVTTLIQQIVLRSIIFPVASFQIPRFSLVSGSAATMGRRVTISSSENVGPDFSIHLVIQDYH